MIQGGCDKCYRTCSSGIDSYLIKDGKIVEKGYTFDSMVCYSCYDKHYSVKAIRDKKIDDILKKPWYKIF